MSWIKRQSVSSPRSLLLTEQSGRRTNLNTVVITNFEINEKNGEFRPTSAKDANGRPLDRALIYAEVASDDPRYVAQKAYGGAVQGLNYTYRDPNGKTYLLMGALGQNGKFSQTSNAGAALKNNFANWQAGKTADFTDNAMAIGQQFTRGNATTYGVDKNLIPTQGMAALPVRNANGTAGLSRASNAAVRAQQPDDELSKSGAAGDNSPDKGYVAERVTIENSLGVTGFDKEKQLKYPLDMISDHTDYLMISVKEYVAAGASLVRSRGEFSSTGGKNTEKHKGTIILPIPSTIQDGNSVKYGDSSLDGITAAAAQAALGVMTELDFRDLAGSTPRVAQAAGNAFKGNLIGNLKDVYLRGLAATAANLPGVGNITKEQLLARESGGILNPNMELLFNGVTLRSFKFSFKMTPRSEDEAKMIKKIIRVLKSNMAPKVSKNGNNFLSTPNVFDLSYMSGSNPHPFLHAFKTCALTDMSVNYTGEGLYATYGGKEKSPVSMVMDLTFKELEAIYDEDYTTVANGVGY